MVLEGEEVVVDDEPASPVGKMVNELADINGMLDGKSTREQVCVPYLLDHYSACGRADSLAV